MKIATKVNQNKSDFRRFAATGVVRLSSARISRHLSLYSSNRRGSFDDALARLKPVWPGSWLKINGS
ncbi:hypothetical protein N8198_10875, partial [Gammaproteobacteria bacterium]|nr:hypothetical protein [Gammaproteobacteria bacterium]